MISRARLKFLRSLHRKKARHQERLLLVEGLRLVEDAVVTGHAAEVLVGPRAAASPFIEALRRTDLPVHDLGEGDVAALADTRTPQGVFALCRDPCRDLRAAGLPAGGVVLVADGVGEPGNLGALVRSAAALGAAAVVTTPGTVEPTNPKAVRGSMGALFRLPVLRGEVADLRRAGFHVLMASIDGAPVDRLRSRPPRLALVVGGEPRGVGAAAEAEADGEVAIPLEAGVESLNVPVAAGILLHALQTLPVEAR
ncbi:MAG: TrmH family RNA methyltransferase [Planctomycetota bacterium]